MNLVIHNEIYDGIDSFSEILLITDKILWLFKLVKTGLNQYVEFRIYWSLKWSRKVEHLCFLLMLIFNISVKWMWSNKATLAKSEISLQWLWYLWIILELWPKMRLVKHLPIDFNGNRIYWSNHKWQNLLDSLQCVWIKSFLKLISFWSLKDKFNFICSIFFTFLCSIKIPRIARKKEKSSNSLQTY